jgi:TatD DNase family protein
LEKKRNEPTSVKYVVEEIAEIKKMGFEEVDKITTENAIKFFNLNL